MSRPEFSAKEFQRLGEIMYEARSLARPDNVWQLVSAVQRVVPYEFSGCGAVNLMRGLDPSLGHSTYPREFCQLYMGQGLAADPAVHHLLVSGQTVTSSADHPEFHEPKEVTSLKLDFGIKTCLSAGVRGINGLCSYFAFSNFDAKQTHKLRLLLDILTPHFHLSFLRCSSPLQPARQAVPPQLSRREEEILRWVAAGKTNWEISVILKVSLNTVKFHLKNIFQKIGVENRWSAIAYWQQGEQHHLLPTSPPSDDRPRSHPTQPSQ
ncbi:MAG TPA: LuxR C-terminal-related transcriptional regulator [Nitrospiraceae bacterium]|jgi:DNA-binding CsgD family transcriptional regulator|nr:LuxR C-terminal-related transcriptional regulator [Nitrospiraceae bacterium]